MSDLERVALAIASVEFDWNKDAPIAGELARLRVLQAEAAIAAMQLPSSHDVRAEMLRERYGPID